MADQAGFSRRALRAPDQFFTTAGKLNRYIRENRRNALIAGLVVVAIAIAGFALNAYGERRSDHAAALFARAVDALANQSTAAAGTAFGNLVKDGHGIYGQLGNLFSADLAVQEGDHEQASQAYQRFTERATSGYLRQIGLMGMAHVSELSGDPTAAGQAYARAAQLDGPYRGQALRGLLRTAEATEDTQSTRRALESLLELYPASPEANDLSRRLGLLDN